MKSATISAKIPLPLKRKIQRYRIVVSEVVRTALEREALRAEASDLSQRLDQISSKLSSKLKPAEVVVALGASRRER